MEERDLSEVCQIEEDTFSMPWSRQSFLEALRKEENIYLVAEMDGSVVGYCGMWGVVGEGQINNVAVAQKARGKGIASQLFSVFLEEGKKKGLARFTLEVRVSNLPAIHLYEKYQFESAGIRKNFYEHPSEDAMIMWKDVES